MNPKLSSPGPKRRADNAWSRCYGWAIEQIACPAFCCTPQGAVSQYNQSARRLWGCRPDAAQNGLWDGFAALYEINGIPIAKSFSPAAIAAQTGQTAAPVELIAESVDGQQRRLVVHARPVLDVSGKVAGILCSLTDISERRRFENAARQADENRHRFLRILAHELRNPLAAIMSAAQVMKHVSAAPDVTRMAGIVERQTRQLARFVSDLLDASRIEQCCEIPVALQTATVGEVMRLAQDLALMLMRSRQQTLIIDIGKRDVRLQCDPARVAQALGNVLLNASEYSDDGSSIVLTVSIDGSLLNVQVTDQGIGAEPYELRELFKPFSKLRQHPSRIPSGAGVGLAVARSICSAHGGMLSAHSEGSGQGMRMRFVLPVVCE